MRFARYTFLLAGIYGLLAITPLYFLEERIGRDFPPAITHPEHYYGFAGVALAWQIAFLIIASDPLRFRPIMLAAVVEKFSYGFALLALASQGRIGAAVLGTGLFDLFWGVLFVAAFLRARKPV